MEAKYIGTFVLKSRDELLNTPGWEEYRHGKSLRNIERNDYIHITSYPLLGEKVKVYFVNKKLINSYDIIPAHYEDYSSNISEAIYYISDFRDMIK